MTSEKNIFSVQYCIFQWSVDFEVCTLCGPVNVQAIIYLLPSLHQHVSVMVLMVAIIMSHEDNQSTSPYVPR